MRYSDEKKIAAALAAATDAAGTRRLFVQLGYEPVADADATHLLSGAARALRIAAGSGVDVLFVEAEHELPAPARVTRIRAMLAGVPRALLAWPAADTFTLASGGLDGRPRLLVLSRLEPRASEVETLLELAVREEPALSALSRHARALDKGAISRRFFRDFRARRDAVSAAWSGLSPGARADRDQLALLLLSRIVFLYFLQKQGHLLGRSDFLISLIRDAALQPSTRSIFRRVLQPLFFGVLNRAVDERDADARALGALPYLNGGLFEPHALERRHLEIDLPDDVVVGIFERFFERYRFTVAEGRADDGARGIQPEMLGRMFEGLMVPERRERTGTFYTPAAVVDRIVMQALQGWLSGQDGMDWRAAGMLLRERAPRYGTDPALLSRVRHLRMVDPACGSGAFVLGALQGVVRLRAALGEEQDVDAVRRDVTSRSLHGVDVEADAALLCALRLWLALTPAAGAAGAVQPLPNLDQRVRQGDALLDPVDLAARGDSAAAVWQAAAHDPGVRRARRLLGALVQAYASASASRRSILRQRIGRAEVRLARRWIAAALQRVDRERRAMQATARVRDLFGERAARVRQRDERARLREARHELKRLERGLREQASLPFFSFALHFGQPAEDPEGFDLVLSNPPWVRSHRWPRAFGSLIRARYRVCREGGWRPPSAGGIGRSAAGQVDLALLFVERALDLLRPKGVLAMLLPAKAFRSISAGGGRALLLERCALVAIEDHALHHRAIFRGADAFAGVVVARAPASEPRAIRDPVRVTMTHRSSTTLRFVARARDLNLVRGDTRSPWLIVPPDVRAALRRMQRAGAPLGRDPDLAIRRGAMTGANDALLFETVERKLGDAVVARRSRAGDAHGARGSVLLHTDDVCPVVRGSGIRAFRFDCDGYVAWCHDDRTGVPRAPSRRLARHLAGAEARLRARPGWHDGLPLGAIFRLDSAMLRPRVAWRDIATDLELVRLPARVQVLGTERPLVALNTVYFVAVDDELTANALVALLSSLPCRVFARSIAERAKDSRFRFFAWTVASIPLPGSWMQARNALARLGSLAQSAARSDGVGADLLREIDALAADLYGLSSDHAASLRRFDDWLAGRPVGTSSEPDLARAS